MAHERTDAREERATGQIAPTEGDTTPALSQDEMAREGATDLPDREAMSLVNANLAAPINLAAALNVLSDGSTAGAGAFQDTPIDQST